MTARHDNLIRRMARHRLVSRGRTIARRLVVAQRALSVRRCGRLSRLRGNARHHTKLTQLLMACRMDLAKQAAHR
jgi:hypothetical protein